MKLYLRLTYAIRHFPAAFGRLRVETDYISRKLAQKQPAAFGRLRVETLKWDFPYFLLKPAAFGRLRVETAISSTN